VPFADGHVSINKLGSTLKLGPPRLARLWVFCRIDYQLATPAFAALARSEHIYKAEKFSDHAPNTVDYEFVL